MKKRILLISFEYPVGRTYCGGVGQIVKQCRTVLLEMGYEVYVLISSEFQNRQPVKLLLSDDAIRCYRKLGNFLKEYDWHSFKYIIHHFVNWTKDLKREKKRKGTTPKIIYHFHSILRRERDLGFRTLNRFLRNQERMIGLADKIICPSRYEYDNFARYFPRFSDKVRLIENTVETFDADEREIQSIKQKYRIKKRDIVSLYVGRLEKIKGADLLIRHIPKLLKTHKNLKIFMVGKSLERNIHKKLLSVQKRFPRQLFHITYLEKRKLFQIYYLSQIYVNTSLSESFSLATHESALCDNALLLGGLPIFDKFKGAAMFYSNHDSRGSDFVSKFESLLENRRLRGRLSKKAARIARSFMARERLKDDFYRLFNSV